MHHSNSSLFIESCVFCQWKHDSRDEKRHVFAKVSDRQTGDLWGETFTQYLEYNVWFIFMKRQLRGRWRSSDRVRAVGNTSPFLTARHSHIYFESIPYTCFCKCRTRWCICPQLKMLGNRKWVSLIELRQLHLGIDSFWSQTECTNLKCNIYCLNSVLDCIISSRVSVMKCEQNRK